MNRLTKTLLISTILLTGQLHAQDRIFASGNELFCDSHSVPVITTALESYPVLDQAIELVLDIGMVPVPVLLSDLTALDLQTACMIYYAGGASDNESPYVAQTANLLLDAISDGIPLYMVGNGLAFLGRATEDPNWINLTRLDGSPLGNPIGVLTFTNPSHPIFDGPFGTVEPFNVSAFSDRADALGLDEEVLARSPESDIILAYTTDADARVLIQNQQDRFSQWTENEREQFLTLSRNALSWLMDSPSLDP